MAFWKKNERRKRELEGIKSMVEGKQNLPPPPAPEGPMEELEEIEQIDKEAPILDEPSKVRPVPKISFKEEEASGPAAPLFIKIDKYEDVLYRLKDLKNSLQTLTRLISFHSEVEELKADIFSRIKDSVSNLTDILIAMDDIFVKPERPDLTGKEDKEDKDVEEQILDLGEELRHLKRELSKIE